jgi:signal transduction histidine kinase
VNAAAPIDVLVADDDDSVRTALSEMIQDEPSMRLVAAARDACEAIELSARHRPDVALLDVRMPGGGSHAARGIKTRSPDTRVLALSAYEDRATVLDMLRSGATGYLVKGASAEDVYVAIQRCVRGQSALSGEVTGGVIEQLVSLVERSERQSAELRELDRMKSEMIQILSHELFTPVTTIQGVAGTLASGWDRLTLGEAEQMVESVSRASARLRRLIGNITAAAGLSREGAEISTRPVSPDQVLSAVVEEFRPARDRIQFAVNADPSVRMWANLDLAVRAVALLLENALEYSPEEEPVEIDVREMGSMVQFAVSDRGPGLPEESTAAIFDAFHQGDASTARGHDGLGIGLFLARRIMDAHRGELTACPRSGGGTTVIGSFPALVASDSFDRDRDTIVDLF